MRLESWSGSDIGLVRQANEDAVGRFPELALFIVADGMGGRSNGDVASRMAVDLIRAHVASGGGPPDVAEDATAAGILPTRLDPPPLPTSGDGRDLLVAAIESANERILEVGVEDDGESGQSMGTTVVALHFPSDSNRVCWAHVGDSRLYRIRGGEIRLLTADHTRYGSEYLTADVIPNELPHTNRLLQALGTRSVIAVTTRTDVVHQGDMFLLCTDGISGLVPTEVMQRVLRTDRELADAGQSLIRAALDAGGKDNASVVLVRASES